MTTNWPALTTEFNRVAAKFIAPDFRWNNRISGVIHFVTKPDCWECGGDDYIHSGGCSRGLRQVAGGSTSIAFGNAVIKAAAKLEFRRSQDALMWKLKRALAPEKYGAEVAE